MNDRHLDDWLDSYMIYTHNSEPPNTFRKWTAISCIASCLQRKCYTQWEKTVYPNLYIVLCGPSGCRKGTAMGPGADLLHRMGESIEMSPDSVTREQLIRRLKSASGSISLPGGLPSPPAASLTIFSEELTVFLGYNNLTLMADLCNWYDCPNKWDYETKGQGKDNIVNIWVNLIGATTPRLLQTTLPQDSIGGGLTARIIFIMETHKQKTVSRPFMTEDEVIMGEDLLHDLNSILMMHGEFIPTPEFLDMYDDWYINKASLADFHDYRFEGYVSRRATHLRKLSMVFSASRDGDMFLRPVDFTRALSELENAEIKMRGIFIGMGQSDLSSINQAVIADIISHPEGISFGTLLRIHQDDADYETLHRVWMTLLNVEDDSGRMFRIIDKEKKIIQFVGGK